MSPAGFQGSRTRFFDQAYRALTRWTRPRPVAAKEKNVYYRPSLDGLEVRFLPATILTGNQLLLGINDGGSFVTPDKSGDPLGLRFGGVDFLSPGIPLGGFAVSVNNQTYFNSANQIGLPGTLTDFSTPGTLAYRFTSEAIPGLRITREIAMPSDSRQILISMTFENISGQNGPAKSFSNIATLEIDDADPSGFTTINDVLNPGGAILARSHSSNGLTLGLFALSSEAYASILGDDDGVRLTDHDPLRFLPGPIGSLPAGTGDPNGKAEDASIRLAQAVAQLDAGASASFFTTLLVGDQPGKVDADALALARMDAPTGAFAPVESPRNQVFSTTEIQFSQPLVGLGIEDLLLTRDGVPVPLDGAVLRPLDGGKGTRFGIDGLAGLTEADGNYQLTLVAGNNVRDLAGRALAQTPVLAWTMDTAPPSVPIFASLTPDTGESATDLITGARFITLTGTADPGDRVEIGLANPGEGFGRVLASAPADSSGVWSITLDTTQLAQGTVQLQARSVDAGGNRSEGLGLFSFTLDAIAPALPGLPSVFEDSGADASDRVTNDATPDLTGTAEPGSLVEIRHAGQGLLGAVRAGTDGTWRLAWPDGKERLSEGSHSFEVVAFDAAGNASDTRTVSVTIDTVAPPAAGLDRSIPGWIGLENGYLSDGREVILAGAAEPGSTLFLAIDGQSLGQVTVNELGRWTFAFQPARFADGTYGLTLQSVDLAGNQDPGFATGLVIDTQPPPMPRILAVVGDSGRSPTDRITQDPVIVLSGEAEPGALVEVSLSGQGLFGTVRAAANGTWTLEGAQILTDGAHGFTARAIDPAGNASALTEPFEVLVDTVAPLSPVIHAIQPDTGVDGDGITSNPNLTLIGTAEAHALVEVGLVGIGFVGSVTTDSQGHWTLDLSGLQLPDGALSFHARALDIAGNESGFGAPFALVLDSVPPGAPTILDASGDPDGDQISLDNTPDFQGLAEPFSLVELSISGLGVVGSVRASADGRWSLSWNPDLAPLAEGNHSIRATATDAAGNTGPASSAFELWVDTLAPEIPVFERVVPDTGDDPFDRVTMAPIPALTGVAEAGAILTLIQVENGWTVQVVASQDGTWHADFASFGPLGNGPWTFQAQARDIAGNASGWTEPFTVLIDTVPPAIPGFTGLLDDTGRDPNDRVTSNRTPGLSGRAEPGSTVLVLKDGQAFARALANDSGTWVLDMATQPLAEGEHRFQFISEDRAGNRSEMSDAITVRIDSTQPSSATALAIDRISGDKDGLPLTNRRSVSFQGISESDAFIEVRLDGAALGGLVTTTSTWNLALGDNLAEGAHTVSVRVIDRAGNASAWSDYQFEIDTIAPAAPQPQTISPDTGDDGADRLTRSNRLTIAGNAEPFSELRIQLNGLAVGLVRADSQGKWAYALPNQLAEGTHLFQATATDRAGNTSATAGEMTFMVDTVAPIAPSIDRVSPDSGIDGDGLVNTRALTIRGQAEPFARVELVLANTTLGVARANAQGEWSLSLSPDSANLLQEGRNRLTARATDRAGNTGGDSAAYDLVLDTQKPDAPSLVRIEQDTGVPGDFLTSDERPALFGKAEPFSTVRILLGESIIGTAQADPSGDWSFRPGSNLAIGTHSFRFQAIDTAGNTGDLSQSYSIQINTDIPPVPVILGFSPNTGSEADWITSEGQITLRGTAKPGARVEILVGGTVIGQTFPGANGFWSFEVPGNLAQGQYRIQARSVSDSGLESALSQTEILEVDSTAPPIPAIDGVSPDSGPVTNDLVTGETNLILRGRAEAGSRVEIRVDGVQAGFTQADQTGVWRFSLGENLANRVYRVSARSVDAAGNGSDWSAESNLVVDTQAPVVNITQPGQGGIFNESTWNGGIAGFVPRNDFESGIFQVRVVVQDGETGLYFDGNAFLSATPVSLAASLTAEAGRVAWKLNLPSSKLEDAHGYRVSVTAQDLAGNASETAAIATFRFDLNAPTATIQPSNQGVSLNFAPLSLDIRFSEAVEGLDPTDFVLPGGARVLSISGEKDRWTVTIQPGPAGGNFEGSLSGAGITDLAGNHPQSVSFAYRVNVGDTQDTALGILPKPDGSFAFQGLFDSANPTDWFQLPVTPGGAFEAKLSGVSSTVLASWYDASGNLLAASVARPDADGTLRLQPATGAPFLRIQPLDSGVTTAYRLVLTPIPSIVDLHANTLDQAQAIGLVGNTLQTSGERLTLGDSEYLRFTATTTGYFNAVASPDRDSAIHLQLIALDARGQVVGLQAPGEHGESAVVRFPVIAGRDYFLRIEGLGDENGLGATGAWTLRGDLSAAADAANASLGVGNPLRLNPSGLAAMRGAVDLPGDGDLALYQAEAAGPILLRMTPRVTSPHLIPKIWVLDQNFQVVDQAQGQAGSPLTANLDLPGSGLYYFRFAALGGSTGGFEAEVHTDDISNRATSAGTLVEQAGALIATGSIELAGDADLFRFVAPKSGLYQVTVKDAEGGTGPFGYTAAVGSAPAPARGLAVGKVFADVGETLYLRIEGIDGASGGYRLELIPTDDDFSDFLDPVKATSVATGSTLEGRLESFGDRDVFAWRAPADGALMPAHGAYFASARADANAPSDTLVSVYRVLTDGSTQLVGRNNDSFLGSDAVVFFQAEPGGIYLFEVQGAQNLDTGAYRFHLGEDRLTDGDDNPASFQLARLEDRYHLHKASDLNLEGTMDRETDHDIFRFVPSQSGQWVLRADATGTSQLDPYLILFDSSHVQIQSDDNAGPGSGALILGNLVAGREYFLSVSSSAGTGGFRLQAQPLRSGASLGNDDFPAENPGTIPAPIEAASKISGSVDFVGDTDTFLLQWPAHIGNATLLARLEASAKSALDPMLEVIDQRGTVLFTSDNTGTDPSSMALFDVDPGQTILLRVSGANKSLGNFNFRIEAIQQPDSDDAPGSPQSSTMPVIAMTDWTNQAPSSVPLFGGKISGKMDQIGDRDFVKIVAPIEGLLTASLRRDPSSFLNPYIKAYVKNPDGEGLVQLAFDDDSMGGLDSKIEVRVKEGQELYLMTSGAAGTTGAYTLETMVRPDDIGSLPTTGLELRLEGLRARATGTIETGSDADWFLYKPAQSGSITVRLHALSGGLNPHLFVYQAKDGALLTSNNDISVSQKDSQVQLQVEAGETYYLTARSAGATLGEYELLVTPVADDFGSSLGAARLLPLAAGNAADIAGRIEAIGDSDWFRIIPTEDGILKVRIDGVGDGAVDPTLAIFNNAGQLLGFADDTLTEGKRDTAAELSIPVRGGRSLFVRAMGYGESVGTYQVSIQAGSKATDDFPGTIDTAELLELDPNLQGLFKGTLTAGDTDAVRLVAPVTGVLEVRYKGEQGSIRAVIREGTELVQVASGNLSSRGGVLRFHAVAGQDIYLLAAAPEDTKQNGGAFEATLEMVKDAPNEAKPLGADLVSTLDTTLNQTFTQLIGMGQTEEDFRSIRDQITSSLVASFLAASGGKLGSSYLVIWLDPVDFVVTDAASQQIGNNASQGAMRENASATLSQKGALDLVVIPGVSAGSFNMQLIGVGGGRVLAGATMIQQDGTVLNPKVTVNGLASDTGIPTGSVPKEGLNLSLDFRGEPQFEPPPSGTSSVASLSDAAQQIVGSLLTGMGQSASGLGNAALASADLGVTGLLTLLVGPGGNISALSSDGRLLDPPVWATREGRELAKLVTTFALEIHDSMRKGIDFLAREASGPGQGVLELMKNTLAKLGFDQTDTIIASVGEQTQAFFSVITEGPLKTELVQKPLNQLFAAVLQEAEKVKSAKTATNAAIKPNPAAPTSPATGAKTMATEAEPTTPSSEPEMPMASPNEVDSDLPIPEIDDQDQLWLEGVGTMTLPDEDAPVAARPRQATPVKTPEEAEADRIWGLVAAAMLAPSWVSSGPVSPGRKRHRNFKLTPK